MPTVSAFGCLLELKFEVFMTFNSVDSFRRDFAFKVKDDSFLGFDERFVQ